MRIKLLHNRRKRKGAASVELRVYFNRQEYFYLSTGVIIEAHQWDDTRKEVVKHSRANALNFQIRELVNKIHTWERIKIAEVDPLTKESLQEYLKGKGPAIYFNDFMRDQLKADQNKMTPGYYKQSVYIVDRLDQFKRIRMNELTLEVIHQYHNFLLGFMQEVSTIKSHKTVRKYALRAVRYGLMRQSPYVHFKLPTPRSRRIHLSTDEIQRLREYKGIERLEKIRDLFLFQCLTGLAYVDMQALTVDDIHKFQNKSYIKKYRQKTDKEPQMIPLLPESLEIIRKYSGNTHLLPKISNQNMNGYLKELAVICKIDKKLSTHVGRHTFAVLMLEKGLPLETISHILGHASTQQTAVYARMVVSKIYKDMDRLNIDGL